MLGQIISVLEEEIDPSSVDVSSVVLKDDLNPKIWSKSVTKCIGDCKESYTLSEETRLKMIHIGEEFFKYINLSLDRLKILDIIFTGSMCNFNWTESSDIDIHIIIDYSSINDDYDLVFDYLIDKYSIWKKKNIIKLCGYDVECYAQDKEEKGKKNSGEFSLMSNKWLNFPSKTEINIDFEKIQEKVASIMNDIETYHSDLDMMQRIEDKIYKMRKSGLAEAGEFSIENLIFKILRRNGTIDYLKSIL